MIFLSIAKAAWKRDVEKMYGKGKILGMHQMGSRQWGENRLLDGLLSWRGALRDRFSQIFVIARYKDFLVHESFRGIGG